MIRMKLACLAVVALCGALFAQGRVIVPVLAMEDQFGTAHDVKQHRGEVLVLIYGDKASVTPNRELGERLHVHYHPTAKGLPPGQAQKAPVKPVEGAPKEARSPNVRMVPVACFGKKIPELIQKLIRGTIKNGSPEVPVWMDFEDVMKANFPFKEGVPNVVVLDTQGRYRYAAAGQPTKEGMQRLIDVIDELRREEK